MNEISLLKIVLTFPFLEENLRFLTPVIFRKHRCSISRRNILKFLHVKVDINKIFSERNNNININIIL